MGEHELSFLLIISVVFNVILLIACAKLFSDRHEIDQAYAELAWERSHELRGEGMAEGS